MKQQVPTRSFAVQQGGPVAKAALLLLTVFVLASTGCKHEPDVAPEDLTPVDTGNGGGPLPGEDTCDSDTVYFEQDILPLIVSNCAGEGCHDAITHENGVRLYDYAHIMQQIVPFQPDNSDLLTDGIWETGNDQMPPAPNAPLTPDQVDLIVTWIQQGAQNNSCVGGCDTSNVTFSGTIQPLMAAKCAGGSCHDANSPAANINLTGYPGAQAVANNGSLAGAVQHQYPYASMPPGQWLTQCEIDQILMWIADGAPNN